MGSDKGPLLGRGLYQNSLSHPWSERKGSPNGWLFQGDAFSMFRLSRAVKSERVKAMSLLSPWAYLKRMDHFLDPQPCLKVTDQCFDLFGPAGLFKANGSKFLCF